MRTDVTVYPLEEANEILRAMKQSRFSGGAVLGP